MRLQIHYKANASEFIKPSPPRSAEVRFEKSQRETGQSPPPGKNTPGLDYYMRVSTMFAAGWAKL